MFEAGLRRGATRPGCSLALRFCFSSSERSFFCCFCQVAIAFCSSLAAYWWEGSR